jgi:hypothetical protein
MLHDKECRKFAKECRLMAKSARDKSQKPQFLQLAEQWVSLSKGYRTSLKPKPKTTKSGMH